MKVTIFRMQAYWPERELGPCPDESPAFAMFSFGPIEPEDPRSLIGSGPFPWRVVEVPDGSRVAFDALFLPGTTEGLHPSEVVERYARTALRVSRVAASA